MSDLQLALIILGALIIGGVVAYNWLQEKKLRQQITGDFIVPQKDVLSDDFHIDADAYIIDKELAEVTEKSKYFEQHTVPGEMKITERDAETVITSQTPQDIENHVAISAQAPTSSNYIESQIFESHAQPTQIEPNEAIIKAVLHEKIQAAQINLPDSTHPQIDLTAILYATKNINSNDLSDLNGTLSSIGLPLFISGLDNDDKWHTVNNQANNQASNSFKQLACSLQLADRSGPVAKNLLNKFQYAIEDAGLTLNAHVEWQGNGDAMQRAIELDQFCIEVDQMVSAHIAQGDAPIHGTKFKGLAEANGMTLKEDGKFHYAVNDIVLFTAIDTNNIPFTGESLRNSVLKSITLQIEIPKVNNCEQVFNQMIAIAQKMAASLNANLVDDNQKLLGDLQIEKIRQQLKVIHATMVARGVMPGSPSSMRLVS